MERLPADKPSILLLHNQYLHKGGEDTVVNNELGSLQKQGYKVYYRTFSNEGFNGENKLLRLLSGLHFFFNLPAFFSLYRFIRKNRIAVVHVHNFFYTLSPSVFWAAKLAGARTVMSMHNYRLFCLNALFFRDGGTCMDCVAAKNFHPGTRHRCFKNSSLFSHILAASTRLHRGIGTWRNKVDAFVVLNPLMKELLCGIGVDEARVHVKPNYITDPGYSDYNRREDFYLYAGRLQEEKGVRHVIEAFNRSGLQLRIAGEGEMEGYIRAHAQKNIQLLGQRNRSEMASLLQRCRGFVFASLLTEGMPMTIIEAQSAGALAIVAEGPVTGKMISDGNDGLLYRSGDAGSLYDRLVQAEEMDTATRNRFSEQARSKFEHCYHENIHLAVMERIYTQPR